MEDNTRGAVVDETTLPAEVQPEVVEEVKEDPAEPVVLDLGEVKMEGRGNLS